MTFRVHMDGSIETTTIEEAFAVAIKWRTEAWEVPPSRTTTSSLNNSRPKCCECGKRWTPGEGVDATRISCCLSRDEVLRQAPNVAAELEAKWKADLEDPMKRAEMEAEAAKWNWKCGDCGTEFPMTVNGTPCPKCATPAHRVDVAADYSKPVGSPEWWAAFHTEHGRDPSAADLTAASEKVKRGVPGFSGGYEASPHLVDQRVQTKRDAMYVIDDKGFHSSSGSSSSG